MKVKLTDLKVPIKAPRELVFQMLSAIGKGTLPGPKGSPPGSSGETETPSSLNSLHALEDAYTGRWKR